MPYTPPEGGRTSRATSTATTTEVYVPAGTSDTSLPLLLAGGLILALITLLALLVYGWHRTLCLAHDLAKNKGESDKIIARSFTLLKHDLAQHTQRLKRARQTRTLTAEEIAFLEEFTEELEEAEMYLEKKLNPEQK